MPITEWQGMVRRLRKAGRLKLEGKAKAPEIITYAKTYVPLVGADS